MPIEKDQNINIYYRQDTTPENFKIRERAPQVNRPDHTVNNPHYEGDNVREILYPTPEGYQKFNRLIGKFTFDKNSPIWKYSDEEIKSALRVKLANKYNIAEKNINIRINRDNYTIYYQYLYYLNASVETDVNVLSDAKLLTLSSIPISALWPGDKFVFGEENMQKIYPLHETFEKFLRDVSLHLTPSQKAQYEAAKNLLEKKMATPNDVWIKLSGNRIMNLAHHELVFNIKQLALQNTDEVLLYKRGKEYNKRFEEDERTQFKGTDYKNLKNGSYFNFVRITPELQAQGVRVEHVFLKKNDKIAALVEKKDKEWKMTGMDIVVKPTDKVVLNKSFEKKYKYEKADIENIFEDIMYTYKSYKDEAGRTYVKFPFKDLKTFFEEYKVPIAKFQGLTEEIIDDRNKKVYSGTYKGKHNSYWWLYEKDGEMELGVT